MKRSEILFGILRIPLDAVAAAAAMLLAYRLRSLNIDLLPTIQLLPEASTLPPLPYYLQTFVLPWIAVFVAVLAFFKLYALRTTLGAWREVGRVLAGSLVWLTLVIAWYFLVQKQLFYSRALLLQSTFFILVLTLILRTTVLLLQRALLRRGIGVRTVLSCGQLPLSAHLRETVMSDSRFRYVGHVRSAEEIAAIVERSSVDLVLHTDPSPSSDETENIVEECRNRRIGYAFLPPVFAESPHLLSIGFIGFTPLLRFEPTPLDGWGRVIKRALDLIAALILLILLAPLILFISLLILITSGWPVFYMSQRIGREGKRVFPMFKFRTMQRNADAQKHELLHLSHRDDGPLFKMKDDPRVTPIGKILRRFSLDELPQLLNVVGGELSLVGPRPHLPEEVSRYEGHQKRVFTVWPGITGLAQISGRSGLKFEDEVRLDMRYIEEWSIGLDLWILWRTVFVVIFGREAD